MIFRNIEDLTEQTNQGLGNFCSVFQYYRKFFFDLNRVSSRTILFKFNETGRDWVINPGGGVELQYQLVFRENRYVMYGLGFNTQKVPFKHKKSPAGYMQPYADSYLSQPDLEKNLLKSKFNYHYHNSTQNSLKKLIDNQYILIGKQINVTRIQNGFEMKKADFDMMLSEIRGLLFETYKAVLDGL